MDDETPPPHCSPPSSGKDGIAGLRVLYAEDHPEMQRAVGRLLRAAGASVAIVHDGLEATDRALAEDFDVVLMDLRMPRMDGFEAARALRAANSPVALVAVTAESSRVVQANALAAGFDAMLPKPFELADLIRAIHVARERQGGQRRDSCPP